MYSTPSMSPFTVLVLVLLFSTVAASRKLCPNGSLNCPAVIHDSGCNACASNYNCSTAYAGKPGVYCGESVGFAWETSTIVWSTASCCPQPNSQLQLHCIKTTTGYAKAASTGFRCGQLEVEGSSGWRIFGIIMLSLLGATAVIGLIFGGVACYESHEAREKSRKLVREQRVKDEKVAQQRQAVLDSLAQERQTAAMEKISTNMTTLALSYVPRVVDEAKKSE